MKTEFKHTPGPWNTDECGDANGNYTIRPDNGSTNGDIHAEVIATVYTEEDAKLIAAAPELLQALNELVNQVAQDCSIGSDPKFLELLQKHQNAIQVIKKATF